MFPKRRIEEIGSPDPEARWIHERDVSRELEAIQAIQKAFFCSETAHDFQERMNAFVDTMAQLYLEHQAQNRATPEEWVMHILPDYLLDYLPTEFCGIRMDRSGVDRIKISSDSSEGISYENSIGLGELKRFFRTVRQKLQDRIREKGLESIHVVDKQYSLHGPMRLHDQKIYRRKRDFVSANAEAIHQLYEIPERSQYLRYPAVLTDVDWSGEETGGFIRTESEMITVAEGLERRTLSLPRVLLAMADAVRGLLFLERHHLRLSDLDFSNIGIDLETGRGTLFDYDGLVMEGEVSRYPAKSTHVPMELTLAYDEFGIPAETSRTTMNEKHAVYELGVSMSRLWEPYFIKSRGSSIRRPPFFAKQENQAELHAFVRRMKNNDPLQRPTLSEVLQELDAACRPYLEDMQKENFFGNQSQTISTPLLGVEESTRIQHPIVYSNRSPEEVLSMDRYPSEETAQ